MFLPTRSDLYLFTYNIKFTTLATPLAFRMLNILWFKQAFNILSLESMDDDALLFTLQEVSFLKGIEAN